MIPESKRKQVDASQRRTEAFDALAKLLLVKESMQQGNKSKEVTTGLSVLAWPPQYFHNYCRLLRDPRYGRRLAGTCLSWMLFDIYAYGVTLYTPEIMEEVFGSSDTIAEDYWQNVLAVLTTVPASILSVYCLAGVVSTAGTARAAQARAGRGSGQTAACGRRRRPSEEAEAAGDCGVGERQR